MLCTRNVKNKKKNLKRYKTVCALRDLQASQKDKVNNGKLKIIPGSGTCDKGANSEEFSGVLKVPRSLQVGKFGKDFNLWSFEMSGSKVKMLFIECYKKCEQLKNASENH